MSRITSLLFLSGAVFLLTSCIKNETVYYDELDVTLTQYEVEFDFGSYTRFTTPDSTILKTNFMSESEIADFYAPGGPAEQTLEILRTKFEDRNYTYTESYDNADFVAVPTVLMMKYSGSVYYPPGWWWGYPGWGWGYPGWGWGYPGYGWGPGYVQHYSYKTGTISLEMVDGDSFRAYDNWRNSLQGIPVDAGDIPTLVIRWLGSIDGYLTNDGEYNRDRARRGIDEAFDQSPYLKK